MTDYQLGLEVGKNDHDAYHNSAHREAQARRSDDYGRGYVAGWDAAKISEAKWLGRPRALRFA